MKVSSWLLTRAVTPPQSFTKLNFAFVICDSSIQVSSSLERICSPLRDLGWTSAGFRAVIFWSPLCSVMMPVETLMQAIVRALIWYPEQVQRVLVCSTFSLPKELEQSFSCRFYEARLSAVKQYSACGHRWLSYSVPTFEFMVLAASLSSSLISKQSFAESVFAVNVHSQ